MIVLGPIVADMVPAIVGAVVAGLGYAGYRVQLSHKPKVKRLGAEAQVGKVSYRTKRHGSVRARRDRSAARSKA